MKGQEQPGPPATGEVLCLIQISRMGDVIQTLQAAMGLKAREPNLRLILVARDKFARPLEFLLKEHFDQIYYLDLKSFFFSSEKVGPKDSASGLGQVTRALRRFIEEINLERIRVCINLSFSKSSTYLTGLIRAPHKLGPYRNSKSQLLIDDLWGQFVFSNVMGGNQNPFNLVDIFRSMVGNRENRFLEPPKSGLQTAPGKRLKVIIHPFTSHRKKQWPLPKWGLVINSLLESREDIEVVLMGGKEEAKEAVALKMRHPRLRVLVGETTLEELWTEMKGARLFIGHDSMGGHFASLLHIQTITVSLGTVRPIETTPYGPDNYNLAPHIFCFSCFPNDPCQDLPCHRNVTETSLSAFVLEVLENGVVDMGQLAVRLGEHWPENVKIFRSEISSWTSKEGAIENNLVLTPLSRHYPNINDVFKVYYKILWNFLLKGKEEILPFPDLTEKTTYYLESYKEGLEKFYELAEFGKKYTRYILEELIREQEMEGQTERVEARVKTYSSRLDEVDRFSLVLKTSFPLLAPLIDFYHVLKSNLKGTTTMELAESSYHAYYEASVSASILYDLVEKNLRQFQEANQSTKASKKSPGPPQSPREN